MHLRGVFPRRLRGSKLKHTTPASNACRGVCKSIPVIPRSFEPIPNAAPDDPLVSTVSTNPISSHSSATVLSRTRQSSSWHSLAAVFRASTPLIASIGPVSYPLRLGTRTPPSSVSSYRQGCRATSHAAMSLSVASEASAARSSQATHPGRSSSGPWAPSINAWRIAHLGDPALLRVGVAEPVLFEPVALKVEGFQTRAGGDPARGPEKPPRGRDRGRDRGFSLSLGWRREVLLGGGGGIIIIPASLRAHERFERLDRERAPARGEARGGARGVSGGGVLIALRVRGAGRARKRGSSRGEAVATTRPGRRAARGPAARRANDDHDRDRAFEVPGRPRASGGGRGAGEAPSAGGARAPRATSATGEGAGARARDGRGRARVRGWAGRTTIGKSEKIAREKLASRQNHASVGESPTDPRANRLMTERSRRAVDCENHRFPETPFLFDCSSGERRGVFPYLPEDSFSPRALRGAFAPMRRPGAAPLAAVVLALAALERASGARGARGRAAPRAPRRDHGGGARKRRRRRPRGDALAPRRGGPLRARPPALRRAIRPAARRRPEPRSDSIRRRRKRRRRRRSSLPSEVLVLRVPVFVPVLLRPAPASDDRPREPPPLPDRRPGRLRPGVPPPDRRADVRVPRPVHARAPLGMVLRPARGRQKKIAPRLL